MPPFVFIYTICRNFRTKKLLPIRQQLVKCQRTYKFREYGTASPRFFISSSRYAVEICSFFSIVICIVFFIVSSSIRPSDMNFDSASSSPLFAIVSDIFADSFCNYFFASNEPSRIYSSNATLTLFWKSDIASRISRYVKPLQSVLLARTLCTISTTVNMLM